MHRIRINVFGGKSLQVASMKKSHGKEINGPVSLRKKNEPLTAALDTMGFKIATMASQHPDRDVAAHLFAIACKITAVSNHLKSDVFQDQQEPKHDGGETGARLRLVMR